MAVNLFKNSNVQLACQDAVNASKDEQEREYRSMGRVELVAIRDMGFRIQNNLTGPLIAYPTS